MEYKIGDIVLYGIHGICKITDIAKKEISGVLAEYYILKSARDDSFTIMVPTESELLTSRMRPILSAREVYELIEAMPDTDTPWIEDQSVRRERYKAALTAGDREELVRMIRALYLHGKEQKASGKKLHAADETLMRDAERMLYDEFAHVLNIDYDDVAPFISEHIGQEDEKNGDV